MKNNSVDGQEKTTAPDKPKAVSLADAQAANGGPPPAKNKERLLLVGGRPGDFGYDRMSLWFKDQLMASLGGEADACLAAASPKGGV
jgi:hypothetical protein